MAGSTAQWWKGSWDWDGNGNRLYAHVGLVHTTYHKMRRPKRVEPKWQSE